MDKKATVKIAFAEAFVQEIWRRGMITMQQRDNINRRNRESLQNSNSVSWLDVYK